MLDDWSHISCNCGIPSCEKPVTRCPKHESLVPHGGCTQGDRTAFVFLFNLCSHFSLELATPSRCSFQCTSLWGNPSWQTDYVFGRKGKEQETSSCKERFVTQGHSSNMSIWKETQVQRFHVWPSLDKKPKRSQEQSAMAGKSEQKFQEERREASCVSTEFQI